MAADFNNPFGNNQQQVAQSNTVQNDDALDWDDEVTVEDTPAYIIVKPGTYPFTVASCERGYYEGNPEKGKSPCNTIKVTLDIQTPEGKAKCFNTLYMKKSAKGFITDFFRAIGMAKIGETFKPDWNNAVGRTGQAKFKNHTSTNGKTYNALDRYIFPDK